MKNEDARCIVLVYVNNRLEWHTAETAEQVCSNLIRAGYVMDALTDNRNVQAHLRELMDLTGDRFTAAFESDD